MSGREAVGQLGTLTDVQRLAILSALERKASGPEALALIEVRFASAPVCGHCTATSFMHWGKASGLARYF